MILGKSLSVKFGTWKTHIYVCMNECIYVFLNPPPGDIQREKRVGGEREEGERNIHQLPSVHALIGNRTCNPQVYGPPLQPTEPLCQCFSNIFLFINLRNRERQRQRQTSIYSTFLHIDWLILVCGLTRSNLQPCCTELL